MSGAGGAGAKHDPRSRLTPAEKAMVARLEREMSREQVLESLKANLQTAIEIELATIPIYLYTYYSLHRNATSGENMDRAQVYANKAGGLIMSVAVEEMLHMSLSANVLYALGGEPQLYGRAPGAYPTGLPYHNPVGPPGPDGQTAVLIPLARYSFEQLWHFLQIEYPEQLDAEPQDRDWDTIGQFYSYIRCLIATDLLTDADFQRGPAAQAIQPFNYSPNNIDTAYPTGKFDPWKPAPPAPTPDWAGGYPSGAEAAVYANRADSHAGRAQLLCIGSRYDAACAIDTICDQGEGYPVPYLGPGADDDPSKGEQSHYMKFLTLQAQFADYEGCREKLQPEPPPPPLQRPIVTQEGLEAAGVVLPLPVSPRCSDYPPQYRAIADFCSACFQYMLIMTETIYRVPPQNQKLFFNEGLHRSMIWVLDKYIQTIRQIPLGDGTVMGPVFENVSLGARAESFAALTSYGNDAIAAAKAVIADPATGADLADVMKNVIYYVGVAISETSADGHRMCLPDVGPYWPASDSDEPSTQARNDDVPSRPAGPKALSL